MDSLCRGSRHIKKFGLHLVDRGLVIKDVKHWRSMEICLLVRSAAYTMKKGKKELTRDRRPGKKHGSQRLSEEPWTHSVTRGTKK